MRMLVILMVLVSLSCERDEPKTPAPNTANETTAAPVKNHRALPPDKQVLDYYRAMSEGRLKDAYDMVHAPDREAKSFEDFRVAASDPLQMKLLKMRTYEIKDIKEDGDAARVDIDTTGPDVAKLQKIVLPPLMKELGGKPSAEGMKAAMERALDHADVPMAVTNNTLFLSRNQAGEWKLNFDWDGEHPGREVPIKRKLTPDVGQ